MGKIILYDASVLSLDFLRETDGIYNYAHLDSNDLSRTIYRTNRVLKLFKQEEARTIPEVSQELLSLVEKISFRKKLFNDPIQAPKNREGSKHINASLEKAKENKKLYETLVSKVYDVYQESKKIHLTYKNPQKLDSLRSLTRKVARKNKLCSFSPKQTSLIKKYPSTDRKLVANAYAQLIHENKQVQLYTNDIELMRLALGMRSHLLYKSAYTLNYGTQKFLKENHLVFDSSRNQRPISIKSITPYVIQKKLRNLQQKIQS